ncbi:uncharacterized protein LOC110019209 isoform X2 [Phalaenopsis equestris]|uniref:uncharacterized protein LOC110019209 isoform X2 n=1 Tax=Phalaenopsis equestris TaxID=78828 RepID=UPI0009E5CD03|nr:uncharacterized protein LOC110019209 isoform X2 [Phalaenopsis equestris]
MREREREGEEDRWMDRELSEDERRALRCSKFAPLPSLPLRTLPRLAHPNGPIATNKAAALAKFLERKLQQSDGLDSLDPKLLELAVKNAKETVNASNGGASSSGRFVRHVASFGDTSEDASEELPDENKEETVPEKKKRKKVSIGKEEMQKKKKKRKNLKVLTSRKQKFKS